MNGLNSNQGRVEVCINGHWGTVCNKSQEGIAEAVCSHLGYPAGMCSTVVAREWNNVYTFH